MLQAAEAFEKNGFFFQAGVTTCFLNIITKKILSCTLLHT